RRRIMQSWQIDLLAVVGVILVAALGWAAYKWRRSSHLRSRFGSEYDRTIGEYKDRGLAESELMRRAQRVQSMKTHPLNIVQRQKFLNQWVTCQSLFVDDPLRAVEEANQLLTEVMRSRGYSTVDAYDRVREIGTAFPRHAENYRRADEIV